VLCHRAERLGCTRGRVASTACVQALRGAPLLFAVLGDGVEHGGATLSFQQRVYQQRASAPGPLRPCPPLDMPSRAWTNARRMAACLS